MKVTLNLQNRAIEKEKKKTFAAHIRGLKMKPNDCISNKLKLQFQNFTQNQNKQPSKCNITKFKLIQQKCKAHRKPLQPTKKQLSIQNQHSKPNNPEIFFQDKFNTSANHLKSINKITGSNHSTKANSREKSRATSVQSSTVCCSLVDNMKEQCMRKEIITVIEEKEERERTGHKEKKDKRSKISKIVSPEITKITRIIMLDWLFQLAAQIQLPKQAVYNCIDYVDKFVLLSQVKKTQYQKIGLSCLFLATKLQMSSHPRIQTFLTAMDNQINRQTLVQTQRKIVNTLKFKLNPPTLYQYMTLVLLTIKSFKSEYKNISWINFLPVVEKDSEIYRRLFWILDGVVMEGVLTHKYGKDDICLAVLYIAMNEQHARETLIKQCVEAYQQTANTTYESSPKIQKKMISSYSENELQFSFECFIRYATTSNKSIKDLQICLDQLQKWRNHECYCIEESEYHEQLKQVALIK